MVRIFNRPSICIVILQHAYQDQRWLWSFDGRVLRLKWDFPKRVWNVGDELFQGGIWAYMTLWFYRLLQLKKLRTRECLVLFPNNDLWPNKSTWRMSRLFVWSTRWEQLHSWAHSPILMPKCANRDGLPTLNLKYVNNPMFLMAFMHILVP